MKKKLVANVVTFSSLIGMNGMTVLADEVDNEIVEKKDDKVEDVKKDEISLTQELDVLKSAYKSLETKLKTTEQDSQKVSIKVQLLINKEKQTIIEKKIQLEKKLDEEKKAKEEAEAKAKEQVVIEQQIVQEQQVEQHVVEQPTLQNFAPASSYAVASEVNTYPWGQCTWAVKELAPWVGNYWGNANQWAATAASLGFEVGTEPRVGSVAVWSGNHVAYVTEVASSDAIQVLESNVNNLKGIANYRGWINPKIVQGQVLYIYPK